MGWPYEYGYQRSAWVDAELRAWTRQLSRIGWGRTRHALVKAPPRGVILPEPRVPRSRHRPRPLRRPFAPGGERRQWSGRNFRAAWGRR